MGSNRTLASHRRALLLALVLLTRLPVGRLLKGYQPQDQGLAVLYYPLVGLLLGLLLYAAALGLTAGGVAGLPTGLAAALLLSLWVALTGALHLDGLADTTDAYFAGHRLTDPAARKERMLAVMREPACGPMAVVALVMLLLLKWAALEALLTGAFSASLQWLLVVLVIPRAVLLPYLLTTIYARSQGLASDLAASIPRSAAWVVCALSGLLTLLLLPSVVAFAVLLAVCILLLGWRHLWQRLICGYTGDCLGALVELTEITALITLCVFLL